MTGRNGNIGAEERPSSGTSGATFRAKPGAARRGILSPCATTVHQDPSQARRPETLFRATLTAAR